MSKSLFDNATKIITDLIEIIKEKDRKIDALIGEVVELEYNLRQAQKRGYIPPTDPALIAHLSETKL
jgi:hypothetical protein